ncbi:MAG: Flp pilus assembly complex ATPase component TadA [Acidobacteria bacterium]|nr:Flp pilus assembly complex ATPase component TadA [Acidobacteriota bacterium]
MPKIDKMLTLLLQKEGQTLRLDPGELPAMDLPGGHRQNLGVQESLGTVLDGIAKEILPKDLETPYLRGEKVQFHYAFEGVTFTVVFVKSPFGTRIVAARGVAKAAPREGGSPSGPLAVVAESRGLETFLGRLLSSGSSDLFLNPEEAPIAQAQGRFVPWQDLGATPLPEIESLIRELAPKKALETFLGGEDVEFAVDHPKRQCRLRVNLLHGSAGPALALRLLPRGVPDAQSLGLREEVCRLASLNRGLVLLTGPMASGRSSTLACLLAWVRTQREAFMITLEDAIEYALPEGRGLVRQREIGRDGERQARAIRTALKQRPELLAVDEWAGGPGLEALLEAACEGRLVLVVLRAPCALDALRRIEGSFIPERRPWVHALLAEGLKAVVGHALIPRAGGGLALAQETLFNTPAVAELLRSGSLDKIPNVQKGARYGQHSQADALVELVQNHRVEAMEAYRRAGDREAFMGACRKAGLDFDPRADGRITED